MDIQESEARSEATLRYTVTNISQLNDEVYSSPIYIRNIPWRICVTPLNDDDETPTKTLGFYLDCNENNKSTTWSCFANAEYRLVSHKEGQPGLSKKLDHLFCHELSSYGYPQFLNWEDVLNVDKGYVKDDAITVEIHVKADEPNGIGWDDNYLKEKNLQLNLHMKKLQEGNKNEMEKLKKESKDERKKLQTEITQMKQKESDLEAEVKELRNDLMNIKSLLVNADGPKLQDEIVEEERRIAAERSAEMQMKFVEFEEFNEIVRSLQADQERIMEECNAMEQTNVNKFNELEGKVEDVQGKINDFLTDVQKDMTDKKNKLIGDLKLNIEKLQKQQKTSTDLIKKLQQQNIERSKVLEVKLGLVEHKFEDTVQMKDSFANFYNANDGDIADSRGLGNSERRGSTLSISTSSSFDVIEHEN